VFASGVRRLLLSWRCNRQCWLCCDNHCGGHVLLLFAIMYRVCLAWYCVPVQPHSASGHMQATGCCCKCCEQLLTQACQLLWLYHM
jgi:hypothetical protein